MGLPFTGAYIRKHRIVGAIIRGTVPVALLIVFTIGLMLSAGYTIRIISLLIFSPKSRRLQSELRSNKVHLVLTTLSSIAVVVGYIISSNFIVTSEYFSYQSENIFYSYLLALGRGLLILLP